MIEPKNDINIIDQNSLVERTELIKDLKGIINRLSHKEFGSIYRKNLSYVSVF
jgi:hypothetical protein